MRRMTLLSPALALGLSSTAFAHFVDNQIYIGDANSDRIYFVNPATWIGTPVFGVAQNVDGVRAVSFDHHTDMLIANTNSNNIAMVYGNSSTGNPVAETEDGIAGPNCIALDGYGWMYVGNSNGTIVRMRHDRLVEWVFADTSDGLVNPTGMAFLSTGEMLVANNGSGGEVRQVLSNGFSFVWDTIPGEETYSVVIRNNQDVYVGCESGNVYRYPGASPGARVLLGNWGNFPSMAFNTSYNTMFHVARGNGSLRALDPFSGASTVLFTGPIDPVSIAIPGTHLPRGSFRSFGIGVVEGKGGIVPEVHGLGNPRIGQTYRVDMHDFVGWTQGYLYSGVAPANVPFMGGVLYIDLNQSHTITPIWLPGNPGAPGQGDWELETFTIPADPLLVGTSLWFQGVADDLDAAQGVSMSHGIKLWIGE